MATCNNFEGDAMSWAYFLTVEKQKRVKTLMRQEGKVLRIYPTVSRAFPVRGKKILEQAVFPSFKPKKWSRISVFKHF